MELDVGICLPSGRNFLAPIHLHGVGAPRGMLILSRWEDLESAADELVAEGFGYSVIDEPGANEEESLFSFQELLDDWGVIDSGTDGKR